MIMKIFLLLPLVQLCSEEWVGEKVKQLVSQIKGLCATLLVDLCMLHFHLVS